MQPDPQQVKSLIDELGLQDLSQDDKDKLNIKLAQILQNQIFAEIMHRLSDEEKTELNSMTETATDQQIGEYINSHVPDLEKLSTQAYTNLKKEMMETSDMVKDMLKSQPDSNPVPENPAPETPVPDWQPPEPQQNNFNQ
jgi:hypothetical protein